MVRMHSAQRYVSLSRHRSVFSMAAWMGACLFPVVLGQLDATPAAKCRAPLTEIRDDIVQGTTHARHKLAIWRAVQPAEGMLLRRGE
eukprot:scaffold287133_cov35-Tisochrysis_lutea.AAC.1